MSATTRKNQQASLTRIADSDNKPAVRPHEDHTEQSVASNVSLRKDSKSDIIQKNQSSSVARQNRTIQKPEREWSLKKRKILFFYELTFISLCYILGATVIFGPFPLLLKTGALAFMWGTARAFRQHITIQSLRSEIKKAGLRAVLSRIFEHLKT
jgi:hypothetical protein